MRVRITSLTILAILILSLTSCGSIVPAVLQENTGDSQYTLSHCYNSIEQFKEFYSIATPATIPELPDYFLSKSILKTNAKAKDAKLHESGEYYEGILYDAFVNSIPCRIDNIRTEDTKGDIEKATIFFGSFLSNYYDISFYY